MEGTKYVAELRVEKKQAWKKKKLSKRSAPKSLTMVPW